MKNMGEYLRKSKCLNIYKNSYPKSQDMRYSEINVSQGNYKDIA